MKAVLLLMCLWSLEVCGQIDWKREIKPFSAFFLAGVAEGTAETLKWHYNQFPESANPDYWNPELSWTRKYKNGDSAQGEAFFGSTTFLVWTTDGYHLARTVRNVSAMFGILLTPDMKGQRWYIYVIKAMMYSVAYTSGFHLSYSLIFK